MKLLKYEELYELRESEYNANSLFENVQQIITQNLKVNKNFIKCNNDFLCIEKDNDGSQDDYDVASITPYHGKSRRVIIMVSTKIILILL